MNTLWMNKISYLQQHPWKSVAPSLCFTAQAWWGTANTLRCLPWVLHSSSRPAFISWETVGTTPEQKLNESFVLWVLNIGIPWSFSPGFQVFIKDNRLLGCEDHINSSKLPGTSRWGQNHITCLLVSYRPQSGEFKKHQLLLTLKDSLKGISESFPHQP